MPPGRAAALRCMPLTRYECFGRPHNPVHYFSSASLAGVSELALGVAYRHIWRQVKRHGRMHHQLSGKPIGTKNDVGVSTNLPHVINRRGLECRPAFYNSKHPIMLLWCLRVFHCIERILNRSSELRYNVPHRLRCLPCHDICKKRRPNVAPVVGGSETHAGGDR